jgi:hypothetical protein
VHTNTQVLSNSLTHCFFCLLASSLSRSHIFSISPTFCEAELQLLIFDMRNMPIFQNMSAEDFLARNNATQTIAVQQSLTTHGLVCVMSAWW